MISPFTRLRMRLAGWYAGSFLLVLVALGLVFLQMVDRQINADVRHMLESTVSEVIRGARIDASDGTPIDSALTRAASELDAPEHHVYLLDAQGTSLVPGAVVSDAMRPLVISVLRSGPAHGGFRSGEQEWRYYATPFSAADDRGYVILALADAAVPERQYARLIELLLFLGGGALVPILIGGYAVAKFSVRPAEESAERIRRFTAEAAHELRTPVAILRARAELALQRDRSGAEYAAALEDVVREAERLSVLVSDLFTLARWESGDRIVEHQPVFLDDLAQDAIAALHQVAEEGGVQLTLTTDIEAPIRGDPTQLRQLLILLLDNAIKFSGRGDRVSVQLEAGHLGVRLLIADTGIGIAAEDLPHVFERFYRSTTSRAHTGGAGLGLAIARRIVDAHGAKVKIDSVLGQGTRVEVRFPRQSGGFT